MKHINSNVTCAIAFKTTGSLPRYHDLVELAVLPMISLKKDRTILPFNMRIQPQRPQNMDKVPQSHRAAYMSSRPPWEITGLFEKWYAKLKLPHNKRIIPVGYRLHTLWPFLMDIFGWSETGENFAEDFFDFSQARSMETITHYWNDLAWRNNEPYPFQKHNPTYAAHRLGIMYEEHRTVLSDAIMYGETWARAVNLVLPTGVDLPINYPRQIDYSVYDVVDDGLVYDDQDDPTSSAAEGEIS